MQIEKISGEILESPYTGNAGNIPMVISLTLKEYTDNTVNIWSVSVIKSSLIKYCIKNKHRLKPGLKISIKGKSVRLNEKWNYFEVDNIYGK